MSLWTPTSPCTRQCVASALPPVSPGVAIVRAARTLRALGGPAARLLRALDVRLETDADRLSDGPGTLVVANHLSWLDIPVLLAIEPVTLLAKSEVGRWPVIGRLATRKGTCYVERGNLRALPSTVAEVADVLRSGRSVVVFPEGTTWCGRNTGPFRAAMFQAALDAGAPVRPVTIRYTEFGLPTTVASYVGDDTLGASVARVLRARALTAQVTVHPTVRATTRRELAVMTRETVHA